MENPVDNKTIDGGDEEKICPYMEIACVDDCPAWLDGLDDCLFHVCMTDVKEVFLEGAKFLDEKLGLKSGYGLETLKGIRELVKPAGAAANAPIIGALLGEMTKQIASKFVSSLSADEVAGAISRAEEVIDSVFGGVMDSEPEGEDEEC